MAASRRSPSVRSARSPSLQTGDDLRVTRIPLPDGLAADASAEPYALAGVQRRGAIGWLLGAFVLLVLVFARSSARSRSWPASR